MNKTRKAFDRIILKSLLNSRVRDTLENPLEGVDGGPGSGNWGHKGRPGEVGGSGKGGGSHFRTGSKAEGFKSALSKIERGLFEAASQTASPYEFWASLSTDERETLGKLGFDANEYNEEECTKLYNKLDSVLHSKRQITHQKAAVEAKRRGYKQTKSPEMQAKRDSITNMLKGDVGDKLFGGLSQSGEFGTAYEEARSLLVQSVGKMDDRVLPFVDKVLDKVSVKWELNPNHKAFYMAGTGTITFNPYEYFEQDSDTGEWKLKNPDDFARSFWHEFGHMVDDVGMSKIPYKKNMGGYNSNHISQSTGHDYHLAAVSDVQAMLGSALGDSFIFSEAKNPDWGYGLYIRSKASGSTMGGYLTPYEEQKKLDDAVNAAFKAALGYPDADEYWRSLGRPEAPKHDDYFEWYVSPKGKKSYFKPKTKSSEAEYKAASEEYYKKLEAWESTVDVSALNDELSKRYDEYNAREKGFSAVSDCFDAATMGSSNTPTILYGGHGAAYYKSSSYSGSHSQNETFANMFSMFATGRGLKEMQTLMPTVYCTTLDAMEAALETI